MKHQLHSLLTKLAANDRDEAVTTAVRLGLLPDRRKDSIMKRLELTA